MYSIFMVGAGSCLGGIARYILSKVIQTGVGGTFPWGTMAVNIIGCLLIGLIYGLLDRGFNLSDGMKLFLTVGFCGGFTTFSTFINENYLLFGSGRLWMVALYAGSSLVAGLCATYSGYWVANRL